MVNIYTQNDTALSFFQAYYRDSAIGRTSIFNSNTKNISCSAPGEKIIRVDNYDVSEFVTGHTDYRSKLDKIIDFINFSA